MRNILTAAAAALLLFGCSVYDPSDYECMGDFEAHPWDPTASCTWAPGGWHRAREAWASVGYSLEKCWYPPKTRVLPAEETDVLCKQPAFGCYSPEIGIIIAFDSREWLQEQVYVHELMHFFGHCSGVGRDGKHQDTKRWEAIMSDDKGDEGENRNCNP